MKILYITTISDTFNTFLKPHVNMLIQKGHRVDLAFKVIAPIDEEIVKSGCVIHNIPFDRSPFTFANYEAFQSMKLLLENEQYDLVHVHTPIASVITRLASKKAKKNKGQKIFYTAHGFHFHKKSPILNWLFYYPIELLMSRYTDVLLTINNEDFMLAKKRFKKTEVRKVSGVGIDFEKFYKHEDREQDEIRQIDQLKFNEQDFILLSVGELNKNKNHETIIRAVGLLNNSRVHYLICGKGPLEHKLIQLTKDLEVKNIHFLGHRNDIDKINRISDVFVFPSIREGLGIAALEAMAIGNPIITSNVHGINDYSINEKSGFTCNPMDVNGFAEAINKSVNNPNMLDLFSIYNESMVKKYDVKEVLSELSSIYSEFLIEY